MKGLHVIVAIASAGIGAAVTYFVTKKYYEDKFSTEVEEIRQMYNERVDDILKSRAAVDEMNKKKAEMMQELEKKVEQQQLENPEGEMIDYAGITKKKKKKEEKPNDPIKFITEAEAQQYSKEYELVGLTLYEDNVLTDDETENIIASEEMKYWIGENGIEGIRNTFGNNEGVYILNEDRKAIYDITVMDERFGDDYEPVTIH